MKAQPSDWTPERGFEDRSLSVGPIEIAEDEVPLARSVEIVLEARDCISRGDIRIQRLRIGPQREVVCAAHVSTPPPAGQMTSTTRSATACSE